MFKSVKNNNHKENKSLLEAENEILKELILEQEMKYFDAIYSTKPDGYVISDSIYDPGIGATDTLIYCYLNESTKKIEKIRLADDTYPVRVNTKNFLGNKIAEAQITKEGYCIKILVEATQRKGDIDAKINILYYVSEIDKKAIMGGFI